MDTVKLINYMEDLRYQRKISQEEYLSNVVSQRQYYRYRYGESEVPSDVIYKLAGKLKIPYLKIISQFLEETEKGKKLVQDYFNLVIQKKNDQAEKIFTKIDKNNLIDDESTTLAKVGKIISIYNKGYYSKLELCTLMKEHMNYNDILKKEALYDFEIYSLGLIMEYSDIDRPTVLTKVKGLLKEGSIYIGENKLLLMQTYFWVVKYLGRGKHYEDVIEYASLAIEASHKFFTYYCLDYFHYYKALAHSRLGHKEEFEKELYKSILLSIYQTDEFGDNFLKTIQKDTGIDPYKFLAERKKLIK